MTEEQSPRRRALALLSSTRVEYLSLALPDGGEPLDLKIAELTQDLYEQYGRGVARGDAAAIRPAVLLNCTRNPDGSPFFDTLAEAQIAATRPWFCVPVLGVTMRLSTPNAEKKT